MSKKINQVTPDTAGVAVGLNANRMCTSPSRLYMLCKNQGKAAVIKHSTGRLMATADEQEYARTARKVETDGNVVVEEVFFVKDPNNTNQPMMWGTQYVIVRNEDTHVYDLIEMSKFNTQNMELGFEYKYNKDLLRTVQKGARYKKGTVFASSARITESGEWCPGVETRVAAMSHVDTEEDAVVIYRSYAQKVGVVFSREHRYQWDEEDYVMLNLYGELDRHQGFPFSGERVRHDGIVMGFRKKDKTVALNALSKQALMEPDPMYDVLFYSSPDCIVADIQVETERYKNQSNNRKAEKRTLPHTAELERIEEMYNEFYNRVIRWYNSVKRNHSDQVPLSPALWNFIITCQANITRDFSTPHATGKFHKVKRKMSNINLKDWRITIKLREDVEGKVRFKNTGMDGNKSVIMKVLPDEEAPIDDHGNRCDMIVGNTPAFRRQILGTLIELDVNFINIHTYPKIVAAYDAGDMETAWNLASTFYKTVNPSFGELVESLNGEERLKHLAWIRQKDTEFSVQAPSADGEVGISIIERLKEQYPDIQPTPVTYINQYGDTIRTRHPIVISSLYYIMLDKFGDDMSCQSTPKFNIFGLPTSLSKDERAREFHRSVGNRNVGETEGRLFINQKGGVAAVRTLALGNSPALLEQSVRRIIRADNPMTIKYLVKPGEERQNHALQVMDNMLSDFGSKLRRERPEDIV
ncbi:hypothetical protein D6_0060 [Aeromonas phage D6]|uniref:DNA-directed RNA polymerase n=2 Tax=Ludhianavirus TaxID=3044751 RepID=A0A514A177_9CAUD|nr:putative DNA directed RNA polymerase beta subunit [Aeromonas phage LAh10]YP_010668808.1 hypothetical protein PQC08_gp215 [Aeromonas phage D6]QDH47028.1 putative DNA directed RNA polymerase beta subunit [Aeromonas phage LAh10]QDJ97220.1 hypothetical protein D6_0060 [Aeromonas phage D6]